MLQVGPRAARGGQIQEGCCHGAGRPRAHRMLRLRPADRPGNTTLHLTTCEVKRHPISNVLFASSRPDIFPSSGHKSSGQARRASAIDPRQCQEECQCPLPSLIHQHRQCRGKMRAQIESEPKHTYRGYRVVRRREVYSHLSKRQSAHHRVIQQVATGPVESSLTL